MKECRRIMRSHALSSFEFLSPSLWLSHKNLFAQPTDPGKVCGFCTYQLSGHSMQGAKRMSWQQVLTVWGQLRTRQTRGLSQVPPRRETGELAKTGRNRVPAQRATQGRQLEFPKGAISGWDGFVHLSWRVKLEKSWVDFMDQLRENWN